MPSFFMFLRNQTNFDDMELGNHSVRLARENWRLLVLEKDDYVRFNYISLKHVGDDQILRRLNQTANQLGSQAQVTYSLGVTWHHFTNPDICSPAQSEQNLDPLP